jgi:hypothetical protein
LVVIIRKRPAMDCLLAGRTLTTKRHFLERELRMWGELVSGHFRKGLVEFVGDGLEFFLFMDQLICKNKPGVSF